MSFKITDLPWLAKNRPDVLKDRFLGAFVEHNGNLQRVWRALDITAFTWYQYCEKLGLRDQIVSLRDALSVGRRGRNYTTMAPKAKPAPTITDVHVSADASTEISEVWSA